MIMVLALTLAAVAAGDAGQPGSANGTSLTHRDEAQQLRQFLADAKARGETPDPALLARLNELTPAPAPLPEFPAYTPMETGLSLIANPWSPLEQQIQALEAQLFTGSASAANQPEISLALKDQLSALYAQRPENQSVRNPLDQGGDNCATATVIPSAPYVDTGTTVGRANDFAPSPLCPNASTAPDIIYRFNPLVTATYTISLAGSLYDTYLYVRTGGGCPGAAQIACNDDYFGTQSFLSLTLTAGTDYYIIVDGSASNAGQYLLQVRDDCDIFCGNAPRQECEEAQDSTNASQDCDGACNNVTYGGPDISYYIFPGQTICGQLFTYIGPGGGNFRDTDWWGFSTTEQCTVRWSARAEYPIELFLFDANCTFASLAHTSGGPCTNLTAQAILPAGQYFAWIGTSFFGPVVPKRDYTAMLTYRPTTCPVAGFILAPGSFTGNTCGAGNDCSLRPTEDQVVQVVIPFGGLRTFRFSLCGGGTVWDSYLYVPFGNSTCCDPSQLAQDDDFCGSFGLSQVTTSIYPYVYYVTIEGFSPGNCGPYTLTVTEVQGSCCYGDSTNRQCQDGISQLICQSLSGNWNEGLTCANTTCGPRPPCQDDAEFGQLPFLPNETWDARSSDENTQYRFFDNFSGMTRPISSARFWGLGGLTPCTEQPQGVQITFYPDSAGYPRLSLPTATFSLVLGGTFVGNYSFGSFVFSVYQFDAVLPVPVNLAAGWMSVVGKAAPGVSGCDFYWLQSPQGNGSCYYSLNGGFPQVVTGHDLAFCLAGQPPCPNFTLFPGQSVTARAIEVGGTRHIRLAWYISNPGIYEIWSTTSHNNDGDPDGGLDSLWHCEDRLVITNANGVQVWVDPNPITALYKNYVVIQTCRPPSDACDHAIDIDNGSTRITNVGADTDGRPSCGLIGADVWFRYVATCTGTVTVNTCFFSGIGSYDTVIDIYDGSCDGVDIVCDDDACGSDGLKSQVSFPSSTGHVYYIRVGGFNGSQGIALLSVTCS
jgi:hypothetical protein